MKSFNALLKQNMLQVENDSVMYFRGTTHSFKSIPVAKGLKKFSVNKPGVTFDFCDAADDLISGRDKWQLDFLVNEFNVKMVPYDIVDEYSNISIRILDKKIESSFVYHFDYACFMNRKEHTPCLLQKVYTDFEHIQVLIHDDKVVGYDFNLENSVSYGILNPLTLGDGFYDAMINLYTKKSSGQGVLFAAPQSGFDWARWIEEEDEEEDFPDKPLYSHEDEDEEEYEDIGLVANF